MSDTPKNGTDRPQTPAANAGGGDPAIDPVAEAASSEAPLGFEIGADQLKEIIAALQTEADGLRSQHLRLLADMDNLRKRTEREREDTAKYAVTRFAADIVGVADNFERAAAAVPAEAAEKDPALKSFLEGVVLAEREFLSVLERHGVNRVEAAGQPFNPHQHQAVMEREDASVPAGTVLQVFQAGFMIEDRCLRPAMVVVSTGGPKAGKSGDMAVKPAETAPAQATDPAADAPASDKPEAGDGVEAGESKRA